MGEDEEGGGGAVRIRQRLLNQENKIKSRGGKL